MHFIIKKLGRLALYREGKTDSQRKLQFTKFKKKYKKYSPFVGEVHGYRRILKVINQQTLECQCVCGKKSIVRTYVFYGTTSCGCMNIFGNARGRDEYPGVYLRNGAWKASITIKRKLIYLGVYKTREEAIAVRAKVQEAYFTAAKRIVQLLPIGRIKDITDQRFGNCKAIAFNGTYKETNAEWICLCDCGNVFVAASINLRRGDTTSCGCVKTKLAIQHVTKDLVDGTKLSMIGQSNRSDNTSGHRGVSWSKERQKWYAYITYQKKMHSIGFFDRLDDAIAARKVAEEKYFQPVIDKYKK